MDIDIAKLRQVFFQDAQEHLEAIECALSQLDAKRESSETINALFCSIHSLKGDSGALGFEQIESLLHSFETFLDLLRDGRAQLDANTIDVVSLVVDCTEELLTAAREDQPAPPGVDAAISLLDELKQTAATSAQQSTNQEPADDDGGPQPPVADFGLFDDAPASDINHVPVSDSASAKSPFFGDFLVSRAVLTEPQLHDVLCRQREGQPLLGKLLLEGGHLSVSDVETVLAQQADTGQLFGEVAVALELLEEAALHDALLEQQRQRPSLRQTIVDLGYADASTIARRFSEFTDAYPEARATDMRGNCHPLETDTTAHATRSRSDAFDCDPQLLAEFVSDSDEHLSIAEDNLLVIESDAQHSEALNAIYRSFHTVKGLASFLGLEDTRNLAHQAESMLNMARDGQLQLVDTAFEVALASVDALKRQVQAAKNWLQSPGPLPKDPQLPQILQAIDAVVTGKQPTSLNSLVEAAAETATTNEPSKSTDADSSRQPTTTHLMETIKVDRDRLDKLINVIGELVIGQAMVEQEVCQWQQQFGCESFAISQLNKTVRDLQELSLSLRMVPVGSVFHKMARIVRDLGRKLGKEIAFHTEGDDTELDKTVVDQIGDPLLHMVRNAADHGIETPAERQAAGKPAQGNISLRAYHQGGNIYLEITDDGNGIDSEALLRKAIERGVVHEGDSLTESEIQNLIFAPGFSTAQQVTDVSGRGVGMDVVRRNVEALQGSVSVRSEKGIGSTVTIRLPLTLAILDGLSIRLGTEVYIVPILSVVESFSPTPQEIKTVAGQGEVVILRDEIVPLLRLHNLLASGGASVEAHSEPLVVIVEDGGRKYALLVDELLGQSQVVIKNLETNYEKVEGLAGATILGDGRVAMIIDVFGLVSLASREDASAIPTDRARAELPTH